MLRSAVALALAAPACGPAPSRDAPADLPVVRPARATALDLAVLELELPPALAGSPLHVTPTLDGRALVGGAGGLFVASEGGFESIASIDVRALATVDGVGPVVATPDDLFTWDGALERSPLGRDLGGAAVRALAGRGADLWIGTADALFVHAGGALARFPELAAIERVDASAASDVVTVRADGRFEILREEGNAWQSQATDDERAVSLLVPIAGGRLLGVEEGRLLERMRVADGAAWRRISLTDVPGDSGAEEVEAMIADPSGAAWVFERHSVVRLAADVAERAPRPAGLGAISAATSSSDGTLWAASGALLFRFTEGGGGVRWSRDIAPFYRQNCQRCHADGGQAFSLGTYMDWKRDIEAILYALDEGTMPRDGAPLEGGTVALVRAWKDGGMLP